MRAFFDTSVLIPLFLADHDHYLQSQAVFRKYSSKQAACGAHSLAETYATLTRLPGPHRLNTAQAMLPIEQLRDRLAVISPTSEEYVECLQRSSDLGVAGGTIYDAVLGACAVKAKCDILYTWNVRHYQLLGPEITAKLHKP